MDEIALASWADRLWAWLIDVLLVGILWYEVLIVLGMNAFSLRGILLLAALLFIYWTALEGYRGQSLGKMLLNITVTGPFREPIRFRDAAVESFGKAFLLPFDCLVCWFAFRETRQRLFNKISNTIVVNRTE
jgi:uncharacterized RDD family membrane protein YckC